MLIAYQLIGYLIVPFIQLNIYLRILNNKEDKLRFSERFGITSIKRPNGKLIWIHAASVGEFKSVSSIINQLHNNYNILITTTTIAASNYAIQNFGDKIIHQYAPLDIRGWVNRFLNNWEPSLILWIESDLWPTTLKLIKEKSIKSFLLNSRISPKSFNKWKYLKAFFKNITDTFDEIYAQSLLDKQRLELLTRRKINYFGNLKLTTIEKYNNKEKINLLKNKLLGSKILMLASTHEGEEEIFINIIKKLLIKYNNLKIIIAPRHPRRSKSIVNIFKNEGIKTNIFDKSSNFTEDVFITDTLGEMTLYYLLSDIVILGGSFIKMGGHNPIEPANNNCVVITGPHIYNWENVFIDMINSNACIVCRTINKLDQVIKNILLNKNKEIILKRKANEFAEKNFFEIDKLILKINNNLEKT